MIRNRLLTTAALALAAVAAIPAAAQAGNGPGDDISDAIAPPNGVLPLSTQGDPHVLGFDVDTTNYTNENEPLSCPTSRTNYTNTVWGKFQASQYGRLDVTAAGFDSVISLYDATDNGSEIDCTDRLAGKIEAFRRDALPTVKKGHVYGVQVGGAVPPGSGGGPGGPLTVDLELIRPLVTDGDAVLTWLSAHGGVKIKSLKLVAPRGSIVIVGCLRKSCGKVRGYGVTKPVLRQKIGGINLAQRLGATPMSAASAIARTAAKPNLKGKRIKNGDTLLIAIQRPDEIGVVFSWRVKRNAAGTKSVNCLEPDTSKVKIRKVGACTGR